MCPDFVLSRTPQFTRHKHISEHLFTEISRWLISNVSYFFRKGKTKENFHTSRGSCPEVFLKISQNSRGKHLCQSLSFNKSACLRLWHKYFPVNFVKISRTPFLKTTSRGCLFSSSVFDTRETL